MSATQKQKRAFAKSLENNGNISRSMLEVGYSPNTAKNPKILTESKGWQELVEEFLPDELLMKVELEGLGATRSDSVGQKVEDYPTRHKYLQTGLELKKKLQPKEDKPPVQNTFNTQIIIQKAKEMLKKEMVNE